MNYLIGQDEKEAMRWMKKAERVIFSS